MSAKAILSASVSAPPVYVEDVFSTFLYTGTGAAQTITNGIDLAGKGGMVWIKGRSGATNHALFDTTRGAGNILASNTTAAQLTSAAWPNTLTSFAGNGFALGNDVYSYGTNISAATYCSWTFRKAAKFFDVVTYTGNGSATQTITHALSSTPGCVIIKKTSATGEWCVFHNFGNAGDIGSNDILFLNRTNAFENFSSAFESTSSSFIVPNTASSNSGVAMALNDNGATYVAYLFAHNAGGFGTAGTDSVVSCGSFTPDGSGNATVTLGWEPQWVLYKRSAVAAENWKLVDNMRGFVVGAGNDAYIFPNTSGAENATTGISPFSTGFTIAGEAPSSAYIYIAIRRGPMKTPTVGTEVFAASTEVASTLFATGITSLDGAFIVNRTTNGGARSFFSRLTASRGLDPTSTASEANYGTAISWDLNNAFKQSAIGSSVQWLFRRAPGFFDVVAYTGTGLNQVVSHNLGVTPELTIIKRRDITSSFGWYVWAKAAANTINGKALLNTSDQYFTGDSMWGALPTSTQLTLGNPSDISASGGNFVAYLFATLTGVSKVGSYTGTGTTLNVDCGFTAGARFVMIKRVNSTGDWYVWDTARGIISGNDPFLLINSTAAEVTGTDYIDPLSSGFQISSTAPAAINANGGTYIFLAIA